MSGSKSSTDFCADDFGRSGTKPSPRSRATSASAIIRGAEHHIHRAGRDRASWHAIIVGFADILRDDETTALLDRLQAKTAVGAGSRKDHADGASSIFASQGIQQEVERQSCAVPRLRLRKPQRPFSVDREIDARRNDIDALAFDFHPVGRQQDWHRRMARQQIHHHAVVARVEVLHDDEGHAIDRRKRVQEFAARVEAAGRGADRDDRKITTAAREERTLKPTWSIRLVLTRMTSRHSAIFSKRTDPRERAKKSIAEYQANCELFRRIPRPAITDPIMSSF